MATPYLICTDRYVQSAVPLLSILVWDESDPDNDISASTATIAVYDENGAVLLASGAATVSGTTTLEVSRYFDTSNASGKCRAIVRVTLGSGQSVFQFSFEVDPLPGPQ